MRFLAVIALVCLAGAGLHSGAAAEGDVEVSRRVLGVYNSSILPDGNPAHSNLHTLLGLPLNHLGFAMDFADVNKPLPDCSQYRAVIVWLGSYEMQNPEKFLPWLLDAMHRGVKVILPNGIYAPHAPDGQNVDQDLVDEILAAFGLVPAEYQMPDKLEGMRVVNLRPELFSFETNIVAFESPAPILRSTDPGIEVWQRVESVADPEVHAVTAVAGAPGFWALGDNFLRYDSDVPELGYRIAWNIDPFALLTRVLDCADMPKPDVTTFWGTRAAYSHVDVDGPSNMTFPDVPGPSRYAMQVMLDEIWKKYPYPVTLGLIAAEYDPDIELRFVMEGETPEQALARPRLDWEKPQRELAGDLRKLVDETFKLPHIQAGCHGYTHPMYWRKLIPGFAIPGYAMTYEQEVRGGVEYLNRHVLPPDKPVELYQWTGDCDPPEEPLAILADMGLSNINGGDPMYDSRFNSVYFICPLASAKGRYLQIHTSGSNENIYTDGWTGYRGAYNNLVATFERSESPRRLLPVNIYYHTFPAERLAGYLAIQNAYDWTEKQELCWIKALEYVRAAESFFPIRMGRTADSGWWVENYGACPTLRFDNETRPIDMRTSRNIAGYAYANGSLYVSLIPGTRAEVRFGGSSDAPCLARASGMLEKITADKGSWSARIRAWAPGFIELWAPAGEWKAVAEYPGGVRKEGAATRLPDGRVRFDFSGSEGQWLEVRFEN